MRGLCRSSIVGLTVVVHAVPVATGGLGAQEVARVRQRPATESPSAVRVLPATGQRGQPLTAETRARLLLEAFPHLRAELTRLGPSVRLSASQPTHEDWIGVTAENVDVDAFPFLSDSWKLHKQYGSRAPGKIRIRVGSGGMTKAGLLDCAVTGTMVRISSSDWSLLAAVLGSKGYEDVSISPGSHVTVALPPRMGSGEVAVTLSALPDNELTVWYCDVSYVR